MGNRERQGDAGGPERSAGGLRRELIRRGHALQARLHVGRQGLTGAVIAQVDQAMSKRDLLKVRIEADTPAEADRLAGELAERVEARLVQRVGRVALLHRPIREERP